MEERLTLYRCDCAIQSLEEISLSFTELPELGNDKIFSEPEEDVFIHFVIFTSV